MQKDLPKYARGTRKMLSIPHLIIIFIVALVVFGPEKLPELARTLGKVMGEFRRATGDLRSTFEDHLRDLERETEIRKIGSPKPAAPPPPTSAVTTAPSAPQPTGTVPTSAPNSTERSGAAADSAAGSTSESTQSTPGENRPDAKPENSHPETVSNGG